MTASRKALIVITFVAVILALPWVGGVGTASAQALSVTSANPSSGEQGTLNLDVTITGKGFKNGANANFYKTRTTDPAGLTVKSTRYVSSTQLVANIEIADTAALDSFDIQVANADGRTGKGTELFKVVSKKAAPATYTWEATLPTEQGAALTGSNVFGPGYGDKVTLTADSNVNVFVSYRAPIREAPGYSQFVLRVWYAVLDGTPQWIGYTGLAYKSHVGTPVCNFPEFNGWMLLPGSRVAPSSGCIVDFLSDHLHPQAPYWTGQLTLRVPDVDFMTIPPGGKVAKNVARLDAFVAVKQNTAPNAYSGISAESPYVSGTVEVSRSSDGDSWTTTIALPLTLGELYYSQNSKGSWQPVIPALTTTSPINAQIVWTRRLVQ